MEHLPAAASLAIRDQLVGPMRSGQVVAVFPTCAYADIAGVLVALEAHDALRLPCAVVLGAPSPGRPLSRLRVGDFAVAGDRRLQLGDLAVRVTRWWAPARPRTAGPLPGRSGPDERAAHGWESLALRLLGAGPGLTPAGDDVLAGLLLGLAAQPELCDLLPAAVLQHAPSRTTWLSAELLRHAAAGHGIPAAVAVVDQLLDRDTDGNVDTNDNADLDAAVARLLSVGHTSGRALAQGILLAAETMLRAAQTIRSPQTSSAAPAAQAARQRVGAPA